MQFIKALLILCTVSGFSKEMILRTKLPTQSLRYISKKGQYSIFQKQSGSLSVSTHFSLKTILKSSPNTFYNITTSQDEVSFLITQDKNYYSSHSFNKDLDIFTFKKGDNKAVLFDKGQAPRFHRNGNWISYLSPLKKIIHFSIPNKKKKFSIKLSHRYNPYYRSKRLMLNDEQVYYTDMNSKGEEALLLYTTIDKQLFTVYKSSQKGSIIYPCLSNDMIYLMEVSMNSSSPGTTIWAIDPFKKHIRKEIYSSTMSDLGQLKCLKKNLYFIKKTTIVNKENHYFQSEVAKIDLNTNKLSLISGLKHVSNFSFMGDRVLTTFNDKLYILEGHINTINDEIKETK